MAAQPPASTWGKRRGGALDKLGHICIFQRDNTMGPAYGVAAQFPDENTLYVAELLNWRVQKLTLSPK